MSRQIISFPVNPAFVDVPIAAHRAAVLARRVKASPATTALLVDLCWPLRDGSAAAVCVAAEAGWAAVKLGAAFDMGDDGGGRSA